MFARPARKTRKPVTMPDDTRTKLLKAAMKVFSQKGYEKATIREICREADVNIALVNYHFGDKAELYLEVVRYAIDAAAKTKLLNRAVEENADPCDALRQLIRGFIERLSETREQFGFNLQFIMKESTQPTPALSQIIDETLRPLYGRLRSLIGQILSLPADHEKTKLCTHSIMGQVLHYALARPVIGFLWPEMKLTTQQRRRVADHIADFSLAYLLTHRMKPATAEPRSFPRKKREAS
ncbi:MAG: CerR family C-terminal domain-containing protein [Acidobacteriaceae bacterium]|nr:CerR family C-terminal domain-containing protein [Acidobacteriaceae bacterium]MBV9782056.1 CerR family C-terminal domain-containing protein [Acidobacteriaceae bacterium]